MKLLALLSAAILCFVLGVATYGHTQETKEDEAKPAEHTAAKPPAAAHEPAGRPQEEAPRPAEHPPAEPRHERHPLTPRQHGHHSRKRRSLRNMRNTRILRLAIRRRRASPAAARDSPGLRSKTKNMPSRRMNRHNCTSCAGTPRGSAAEPGAAG